MTTIVRVTDEDTREDLAETLAHLNAAAKKISRRGFVGTHSIDYDVAHNRLNAVLADLLLKPPAY